MTARELDLEQKAKQSLPGRLRDPIERLDETVASFLERYGVTALRIALAIVFIWFGVLKVIDRSPVEDLVKDTIYFLPEDTFFVILGIWEIVIGIGLLIPVALRLTLLLFWLQMAGTFLSLIILPGRAFQDGNPLLLDVTGEFIIKNLVLIAAGLVIGSTVRRHPNAGQAINVAARAEAARISGRLTSIGSRFREFAEAPLAAGPAVDALERLARANDGEAELALASQGGGKLRVRLLVG